MSVLFQPKSLSNNEIFVLILSTNDSAYDNFKRAIQDGWVQEMQKEGIKCFFYCGDSDRNVIEGNQIYLKVPDKLESTAEKLFLALKVLIATYSEVRLVYRTNLSSYIEINNFLKFIKQKELNVNTYAGVIGETTYLLERFKRSNLLIKLLSRLPFQRKIRFSSGSGFFLGRNHIEKILNSNCMFNLIDDVMVACALNVKPEKINEPKRFDIQANHLHKIDATDYQKLVDNDLLFHYRFKTVSRSNDAKELAAFHSLEYRYSFCTKTSNEQN